MRSMIADLLLTYTTWLFAAAMYFWFASVLYRTTRNTVRAYLVEESAPEPAVVIPPRPVRRPRVPLTPVGRKLAS